MVQHTKKCDHSIINMHLKRKKYYNIIPLSTNWGKAYGVILKLSSYFQKWHCLFWPLFIFSSTALRLNLKHSTNLIVAINYKHWHLYAKLSGSVCNLLIITNVQNLMRLCCCLTDLIESSHDTQPLSNAKQLLQFSDHLTQGWTSTHLQ